MSQAKPEVESWQDQSKRQKRGVPEGLWQQCPGCSATVYRRSVEENQYICPQCDHHFIVPEKSGFSNCSTQTVLRSGTPNFDRVTRWALSIRNRMPSVWLPSRNAPA